MILKIFNSKLERLFEKSKIFKKKKKKVFKVCHNLCRSKKL